MSHVNATRTYIEDEARHEASAIKLGDRPPIRMPVRIVNGGFHPMPLPVLTRAQAQAAGWPLYCALLNLHNVLAERGQVADLVISNVWGRARAAVRRASQEAVAASEPADGSDPKRESETTAVEATRNKPSPGA
jgi:hypothetical protein